MKKHILLGFFALTSLSAGAATLSSENATAQASLTVGAEKSLSVNVEPLSDVRPGVPQGTPLFRIQAQGSGLDGALGLTDETRKSHGKTGWFAYNNADGKAQLQLTFSDGCTTGQSSHDNTLGFSVKTCAAQNGNAVYDGTATLSGGNVTPGTYTLTVGAYDFQA
ncbi:TPA: hypothetical protein MYR45_004775 [Escherichia coli]|uniref:hypothetical protein n=1 Tax=Escherichia coli TaxID=562 RepID=UPI00388F91BF|nr:hypothetical protein [Escherichia coli]HCB2839940.1 hypothetical protein [Escherichia coli]